MTIAVVGAGNMGGALYHRLINSKEDYDIWVSDRNQGTQQRLCIPTDRFFRSASDMFSSATFDVILLCIKPQSLDEFVRECRVSELQPDALLISILAGTTIQNLSAKTGVDRIIRAMPNLAITVGAGVTGWIPSRTVSNHDKALCESIFSNMGLTIEVATEEQINQITSLSGSGPAYFFYLTELIQEQAEVYGFSPDQAQAIATQTAIGASMVLQGGRSAKEWRQAVTSKHGTTEAALTYLQHHTFDKIVKAAVVRAKERAEELEAI